MRTIVCVSRWPPHRNIQHEHPLSAFSMFLLLLSGLIWSAVSFFPSPCVVWTWLHLSRYMSFWCCFVFWPYSATGDSLNSHSSSRLLWLGCLSPAGKGDRGDAIVSELWDQHCPLSPHAPTQSTYTVPQAPAPLHPHARPLGSSQDVTLSQLFSLRAAWMWQLGPRRRSSDRPCSSKSLR